LLILAIQFRGRYFQDDRDKKYINGKSKLLKLKVEAADINQKTFLRFNK